MVQNFEEGYGLIEKDLSAVFIFVQGMASFFSPCVLPLIPAYLTYLTGQSAEIMMQDPKAHRSLILNGLFFVIGFSLVFVALGAAASGIGRFLMRNNQLFKQISGIIIIFFGLFHMGLIPIKFLNYERRLDYTPRASGLLSSLLMGMGFSFAWTPCVGPVLSAVLVLAGQSSTIGDGIFLLSLYSLGLGIPFLALTVFIKTVWKYLRGIFRYMRIIKVVSGGLLVLIGILILTDTFMLLGSFGGY